MVEVTALYLYPHANTGHDQTLIQQKIDLGRCWHHSGLQRREARDDTDGVMAGCGVSMLSRNRSVWAHVKNLVVGILL